MYWNDTGKTFSVRAFRLDYNGLKLTRRRSRTVYCSARHRYATKQPSQPIHVVHYVCRCTCTRHRHRSVSSPPLTSPGPAPRSGETFHFRRACGLLAPVDCSVHSARSLYRTQFTTREQYRVFQYVMIALHDVNPFSGLAVNGCGGFERCAGRNNNIKRWCRSSCYYAKHVYSLSRVHE